MCPGVPAVCQHKADWRVFNMGHLCLLKSLPGPKLIGKPVTIPCRIGVSRRRAEVRSVHNLQSGASFENRG